MWQTDLDPLSDVKNLDATGNRRTKDAADFIKAVLSKKSDSRSPDALLPFAGSNAPVARWYARIPERGSCPLQVWLQKLQKEDEPPKEEQLRVLRCVMERLKYEAQEERRDTTFRKV